MAMLNVHWISIVVGSVIDPIDKEIYCDNGMYVTHVACSFWRSEGGPILIWVVSSWILSKLLHICMACIWTITVLLPLISCYCQPFFYPFSLCSFSSSICNLFCLFHFAFFIFDNHLFVFFWLCSFMVICFTSSWFWIPYRFSNVSFPQVLIEFLESCWLNVLPIISRKHCYAIFTSIEIMRTFSLGSIDWIDIISRPFLGYKLTSILLLICHKNFQWRLSSKVQYNCIYLYTSKIDLIRNWVSYFHVAWCFRWHMNYNPFKIKSRDMMCFYFS